MSELDRRLHVVQRQLCQVSSDRVAERKINALKRFLDNLWPGGRAPLFTILDRYHIDVPKKSNGKAVAR